MRNLFIINNSDQMTHSSTLLPSSKNCYSGVMSLYTIDRLNFSDDLLHDSLSGKASLIGLFDIIYLPDTTNGTAVRFTISGTLRRLEGANSDPVDMIIKVISPAGTEIVNTPLNGIKFGDSTKATFGVKIGPVIFKEEGAYNVEIGVKGETVYRTKEALNAQIKR